WPRGEDLSRDRRPHMGAPATGKGRCRGGVPGNRVRVGRQGLASTPEEITFWRTATTSRSASPQDSRSAPACLPKLAKNSPDSFLVVELMRRLPSWAILPPTSALAAYLSTVASGPSGVSVTSAPPLAKPAMPPLPSPTIV